MNWKFNYNIRIFSSFLYFLIFKTILFGVELKVPTEYENIQKAIDIAKDYDTIVLSRGVHKGSINFNGKSITLRSKYIGDKPNSDDISQTVVEGQQDGLPIIATGDRNDGKGEVHIKGVTIRGGTTFGISLGRFKTANISDLLIENCLNGVSGASTEQVNLIRTRIYVNSSGTGLFIWGGALRGRECTIVGASGSYFGVDVCSETVLSDTVVAGFWRGVYMRNGNSTWLNCTIVGNEIGVTVDQHGGGGGSGWVTRLRNCIVWNNNQLARMGEQNIVDVDYSILQGGKAAFQAKYDRVLVYGLNNIDSDPKFVSPGLGDYRLRDDSPAIGSGGKPPIGFETLHESIPTGSPNDIGAFENARSYPNVSGFKVFGFASPNNCFGSADGFININVANGVVPLKFSWSGPNGFSSTGSNIVGLVAGEYTLVVSENTGLAVTNVFTINQPRQLTLASTVCGSFPNVTVSLTPDGGIPPYTVKWDTGGGEIEKSIRAAGQYGVTLTDAAGCWIHKIVLVPEVLESKILYVSKTGNNSFEGSEAKPFLTVQFAIDNACDGDTVIVNKGVYRECVKFNGKSITLKSKFSGDKPDLDTVGSTIIEGLPNGLPVIATGDRNDGKGEVQIKGVTIRGGTTFGVSLGRFKTANISDLLIENCLNGVSGASTEQVNLIRTRIYVNSSGTGLFIWGGALRGRECTIVGASGSYFGVDVCSETVLSDTVVAGFWRGVYMRNGNSTWLNCTIVGNEIGVTVDQHGGGGGSGWVTRLRNCIVWNNNQLARMGEQNIVDVDYSILQGGKAAFQAKYDRVLVYGLNNIESDPKFVSPGLGDYRLRDDSPAIGSGGKPPIGFETLHDSIPIGSPNDIGAFENARSYPNVSGFKVFGFASPNNCFGSADGFININVANGVEPLKFSWSGPNGFSSTVSNIVGLVAGEYTLVVSENTGLAVTNVFTINQPRQLTLASTVCGRFPNVTVSLTPDGGIPPYTVKWDTGGGEIEKSIRAAGQYGVTLTDAAGCWIHKIVLVPEVLESKILYVSKTGNNSFEGSEAKPFLTVQFAIDNACDGDTVIVNNGVYKECVKFNGKSITLKSKFSGDKPDLDTVGSTIIEGLPNGLPVIATGDRNDGKGEVQIKGVTIRGGTTFGVSLGRFKTANISDLLIENCLNGVSGASTEQVNLIRTRIYVNSSGTGLFIWGGALRGRECTIVGASGSYFGVDVCSETVLSDTVVAGFWRGVYMRNGNSTWLNCTIVGNEIGVTVDQHGGGGGSGWVTRLRNCIVWNNNQLARMGEQNIVDVDYSILQGGKAAFQAKYDRVLVYGLNNIDSDPKFVSPSLGDFRLRDDSPVINAGDNSLITDANATDLDGKKRILGGRVDLGAYERWSFYTERGLTAAEGTPVSAKAVAEDIAAMGGVKFQVESGPEGLSVDATLGQLTWTPTEAQGPGTYTAVVRGTAANNPSATDTQTLTLTATEVNRAPEFAGANTQNTAERLAWAYTAAATDPDLPANKLTYRLVSGPAGASIAADSGLLKWTPGEAEGGNSYEFVVEATDNGTPALSARTTVRLDVQKTNHPPTLASLSNRSILENQPWTAQAVGQDLDLPAQSVTYSVQSGPSGLTVDSSTGVIQWTPSEAQGPGKYPLTVRVQDSEGLSAEQTFELSVTEVNTAPSLAALPHQMLTYGQTLSLQWVGSDADLPANALSYRLVSGPTNAGVSTAGQLTWTPSRTQAPSTNVLVVAVSDGSLSATNTVRVEVLDFITLVNGTETTNALALLPPAKVSFRLGLPDWVILYSLDGTPPTDTSLFYWEPFSLTESVTVWPIAFSPDFSQSVVGVPIPVTLLRSQTLSVNGGEGLVHQGPGVGLTVVSDSGLPVAMSVVSGPARLENGQLIPTGGGVVRLKAMQAGNAEWAPVTLEFERLVAKAAQTIAWTAAPDATFRSAPLQLKASASSGLPLVYSVVDGPGTIVGDRLTLTGAGQVVVRATQEGTADFEAAAADQTVVVKKASQTLTFGTVAGRALSAAPIGLVGAASSGLPVVYEVLSGPAQVVGDQLTLTGVGLVVLRASQPGNANYEPAIPKDQQFTVTQGQQTLTFATMGAKTFGDGPVTLSATSSAQLPVTFRVVSGPGMISGDQLTLLGAGAIAVQAIQAGNDQFQAASTSQTITVAKAAQTLTFTALPNATFSTNAVILEAKPTSGLPVGYRLVSGAGTIAGSKLTLSGIGTFTVAADQGGNTNWLAATSVTNSFVVTRGVQTITFAPIGEQVLSAGSVTLSAVSSAGLAVNFSVMSGPATVSGTKLTLLNEGTVTVRAINPGSTLWLAGQAEQSFVIRKLTSLAVTVAGNQGGTVAVSPEKNLYAPTDTVTLTATASSGFVFSEWSGDLTGSANPASLVMSAMRSVTATFKDIQPPVLTWDLPAAGATGVEQVRLSGSVSDNAGVTSAVWSRDGETAQTLGLRSDGSFAVENLVLSPGTNRFALVARDAAGNETKIERDVVWVPARVLKVANAASVQEGQRMVFAVHLISPGDVAGLTFDLRYDRTYLMDPRVEWGALVGQSVNNVNVGTVGQIGGGFALAGTGLPEGTNLIATVSFRARSVPVPLATSLQPSIVSLSSPNGFNLLTGNAVVAGEGRITPRKIKGDNNANQRVDIGDATVISRLEIGLEEKRSWDVALNDLNGSLTLDSGDVVKALRTVVGMDPQPGPMGGAKRLATALALEPAPLSSKYSAELDLPDGPTIQQGRPYRVAVRLKAGRGELTGLSLTLKYPAVLELRDKTVSMGVPADALPAWNISGSRAKLAVIRPKAWTASPGVLAVFEFEPKPEAARQTKLPISLEELEVADQEEGLSSMASVWLEIGGGVTRAPEIRVRRIDGGALGLEVVGDEGMTLVLEGSPDMEAWTETRLMTGQGHSNPVKITLNLAPDVQAKFWRVRVR